MNGQLRELFFQVIKWAWVHEDSHTKMARTIIGAARDNHISSAELRAAIDWLAEADQWCDRQTGTKLPNGDWSIPLDIDVYTALKSKQLKSETLSDTILRALATERGFN